MLVAAQHEDWENLLYIDPGIIQKSVRFLLQNQMANGGFAELGDVPLDAKVIYIHTYIHAYLHTYLLTCIHTKYKEVARGQLTYTRQPLYICLISLFFFLFFLSISLFLSHFFPFFLFSWLLSLFPFSPLSSFPPFTPLISPFLPSHSLSHFFITPTFPSHPLLSFPSPPFYFFPLPSPHFYSLPLPSFH